MSTPEASRGVDHSIAIDQAGILPPRSRRRWLIMAQLFGLLLLVAAIWWTLSDQAMFQSAWSSLVAAPRWQVGLIVILPLCNWVLVTGAFWIITNQYGPVRFREMLYLLGAAWLLNVLPLRPGLTSRVAYHKLINNIAVKDSVKLTIVSAVSQAIALGGGLCCVMIAWAAAWLWPNMFDPNRRDQLVIVLVAAMVALSLSAAFWFSGNARLQFQLFAPNRFSVAVVLRVFDWIVWTARYWLAFAVIGHPVSWAAAASIGTISQFAGLLPVQLGLREWAVGLATRLAPSSLTPMIGVSAKAGSVGATSVGLAADILNRAVELAWAIPIGGACSVWMFGRIKSTISSYKLNISAEESR